MEFTGVHKEDLVKLLKNLKNDHHLILGMLSRFFTFSGISEYVI